MLNAEFKASIRDGPTFVLVASPALRTLALSSKGGTNYLEQTRARVLPSASSPPLSHGFDLTISQTSLKGATSGRTDATDDRSIEDSVH